MTEDSSVKVKTIMYLLYAMIMYANDGKYVESELAGLGVCLGVLVLIGILIWIVYQNTVRIVKAQLQI